MRDVRLRREKEISQKSVRLNLKIMAGFLIQESMLLVILIYFHFSILSSGYYWEDGLLTSIIKITQEHIRNKDSGTQSRFPE